MSFSFLISVHLLLFPVSFCLLINLPSVLWELVSVSQSGHGGRAFCLLRKITKHTSVPVFNSTPFKQFFFLLQSYHKSFNVLLLQWPTSAESFLLTAGSHCLGVSKAGARLLGEFKESEMRCWSRCSHMARRLPALNRGATFVCLSLCYVCVHAWVWVCVC